jgi:energy-coupling factor transport system ATP-binding protein
MIKLENINFKYKKNKTKDYILKDINLTINNGEFISIIGNNGEGKSTLLKLLSGIILPTEGNILINDINTKSKKDFINLRKNISIVFQNPDNQIIFERVYEELEFALKNLKFDKKNIDKQIDLALEKVNMLDFKFTNTENLSLGQKQKIIIAEALSTNSDIIVLDEPTAMLDPTSKKDFLNLLIDLNNKEKLLFYSHIF